jgi:hypothetical protein
VDIINTIKEGLSRYPAVRFSEARDEITIPPADAAGFLVSARALRSGFVVHFEGWHEEFASAEEALDCVTFGLSPQCRLAVVLRGKMAVKWTVESLKGDTWTGDSEVGILLQPFWRRSRCVYRQNHLIPAESSGRRPGS